MTKRLAVFLMRSPVVPRVRAEREPKTFDVSRDFDAVADGETDSTIATTHLL